MMWDSETLRRLASARSQTNMSGSTVSRISSLRAMRRYSYYYTASYRLSTENGFIKLWVGLVRFQRAVTNPGSSSRGRWLKLWTARPVKDRAQYERARALPANIFLTNDQDRAYGIARDLGGGKSRDLWYVVVNEAYLVTTLDAGRTKDYQTVAEAPVRTISLNTPGV